MIEITITKKKKDASLLSFMTSKRETNLKKEEYNKNNGTGL